MYIPLDSQDIRLLKKEVRDHWRFQFKAMAVCCLIGVALTFIPLGFAPHRHRVFGHGHSHSSVSGNLMDNFGVAGALSAVFGLVLFSWIIIYFVTVFSFHCDLRKQVKVVGTLKVARVEHLGEVAGKSMENNNDMILHFAPNNWKINDLYYRKQEHPEYADAEWMYVERAVRSQFVLKSEVTKAPKI